MIGILCEMFSYTFLSRAMLVGSLVSLCAALLGVCMVLKRYAMIGDSLSHVGFGALALSTAASDGILRFLTWLSAIPFLHLTEDKIQRLLDASPLLISLPVVMIAAFLLLRLSQSTRIKGDAALGLISSGALAIGVMTVSLSSGMNTDVTNYMFGSILSLSEADTGLSIVLSICVLLIYVLFYHRIFSVTFDETFARAIGTNASAYNTVLALLTAVTVVLGMRMMGALLISSLIVFPAMTAMRLCKQYRAVVLCAATLSLICFLIGMILSYRFSFPSGASIVCVHILAFLLFSFIARIRSLLRKKQESQNV